MFKNKSIILKVFYGMIIMIITTLTLYYGFTFYYQYHSQVNKSMDETIDLSEKLNTALEDYMIQIDGTISSIYYELYQNKDGALSTLLTGNKNMDNAEKIQSKASLSKFFSQLFLMRRDFVDIYLYVNEERSFQYSTYGGITLEYSPQGEDWYQNTLEQNGRTHITLNYIPKQIKYQKEVIGFSRVIKNISGEGIHKNTVILLDFTMKNLNQLLSNYITNEMTTVVLLDEEGNYVHQIGAEISQDTNLWQTYEASGRKANIQKIGKERYIVASNREKVGNWYIVLLTNYDYVMGQTRDYLLFTIILGILLIIFAGILSFIFARAIFRPIKSLERGMQIFRKGDFDIHISKESNDELGSLIDSFNLMAANTKQLIKEKYEEELEKKDAQFKFLQAQIDPHFIFNTLQIISSMAVVNKTPEIETMSNSLARLIRYSIHGNQKLITIREELKNAGSYLEIQKVRFKDRLNYDIQVDERIESMDIIKLILQPIVENGIHHGLEQETGNGYIEITGGLEDGGVYIEVRDNGVGMEEAELANLVREMNRSFSKERENESKEQQELKMKAKGNKVGLRNINMRLKLYYGEDYGLEITSQPGQGTKVKIRIPSMADNESRNKED